ncbi:MAG: hypothetical protein H6711_03070 [Myxococcales bacterium]|nr:hypothetical protein [Myxococcales bacterium]
MPKLRHITPIACALILLAACGDDSTASSSETATASATATSTATSTASASASASASAGTETQSGGDSATGTSQGSVSATDSSTSGSTSASTSDASAAATDTTTSGVGCGVCDQPNQACVDDVCVALCQGQDPDPCGPDQVCDVISGECKDVDAPCTLAGPAEACGAVVCGPGSVCDGVGECLPIAPCSAVACTDGGECWGDACSCTREKECDEAPADLLNGPFSEMIAGLDFADDCTAWMVTLRDGVDYLRRLRPDGELTEWPGVSNLDMGEVKVLRRLTVPQAKAPPPWTSEPPPPPKPVEGYGEVALTYICCANCGCAQNPPQGVARLVEEDMNQPLPIVITATTTQGNGPFMSKLFDAGPQGLTWGEDRVLYVGNTTANGELNSADLEKATQQLETTFAARVTAAAAISPVHLLVALEGGELQRFNTLTKEATLVLDLDADVTSLSHDKFSGLVYAGLSTLEIVAIQPFKGEVMPFDTMPGKGRVAVSPSGRLWFMPVKYIQAGTLVSFDLPNEL